MPYADRIILGLLVIIGAAATPALSAEKKDLVKTELLSDSAAVAPGKPFTVAVVFNIEQNWHIYWINPGDSGETTEIEWTLPEGFKVSELQYPLPHKFIMPGNIRSYGYARQVVLTATVTPPADFRESTVTIGAKASWLVCEQVCVPGEAKLSMILPAVQKPEDVTPSDSAGMISQWVAAVPTPIEEADNTLRKLLVSVRKEAEGAVITMVLPGKSGAKNADQGPGIPGFENKQQIQDFSLKQKQLPLRARLAMRRMLLRELQIKQRKAQGLDEAGNKPTTRPDNEPRLEWFPPESEQAKFTDPEIKTDARGTILTIHVKPLMGQKIPDTILNGVLSYTVGDEPPDAVVVPFNPSGTALNQ